MSSGIQLVDADLLARTIARAQASERQRANHNLHASSQDNPHRFLNALVRGSYVAPHRHRVPPKAESFLVLEGELGCWIFDDAGAVRERHVLGRGGLRGIDIAPGIWHTVASISAVSVAFEVKPGPWDPTADKEFAPFAPAEGAPEASAYLDRLLAGL